MKSKKQIAKERINELFKKAKEIFHENPNLSDRYVEIARKITGHKIPTIIGSRRFGDPAELIAHVGKIKKELGWEPKHSDLKTIMETAWNWHKNNPNGYKKN